MLQTETVIQTILVKTGGVSFVSRKYETCRNKLNFFVSQCCSDEFYFIDPFQLADFKPLIRYGTDAKFRYYLHHHISFSYEQFKIIIDHNFRFVKKYSVTTHSTQSQCPRHSVPATVSPPQCPSRSVPAAVQCPSLSIKFLSYGDLEVLLRAVLACLVWSGLSPVLDPLTCRTLSCAGPSPLLDPHLCWTLSYTWNP